jgi:hypothetical protein
MAVSEFHDLSCGLILIGTRIKLNKHLESCHSFLGSLCDPPYTNIPQFKKCLDELNRPVRVAIIDNGTDQMRSTISDNIEMGWSFTRPSVAGKKMLPWYTASDPHGTQMAYLIRNVNPYCRLIPIRVGLTRKDIDPRLAAQVRFTLFLYSPFP